MVDVPLPVKWGLRLLAVGYVFLLVAWPVGLVVQHTFEDGLTTLQEALRDEDVINALMLTVEVASVRMLTFIENGSYASAAAVASIMLAVALFVIVVLDIVQRRVSRRG